MLQGAEETYAALREAALLLLFGGISAAVATSICQPAVQQTRHSFSFRKIHFIYTRRMWTQPKELLIRICHKMCMN